MENLEYYIDFDGVILDSQDRFLDVMGSSTDLDEWMDYLASLEWKKFLRECNEIDNSISTLDELQKYRKLKGIITQIHCFNEGKEKLLFLRERGIIVPVIYVLPEQRKSTVIIPNKNLVLVDDKVRNCKQWTNDGGSSLQFDPHSTGNEKGKIKSLKQLL